MSATDDSRGQGLLPLADRIRWTALVRTVISVTPPLLWFLAPGEVVLPLRPVLIAAGIHLLLGLASSALVRLPRRGARAGLAIGLLLDGVLLTWAVYALGGVGGTGIGPLLLHVVGVTLLMSFRSGLKLTLWYSLLTMAALEAQSNPAVNSVLSVTIPEFPVNDFARFLALLWGIALSTATFAAVNERELRRRRYDAEALQRLGLDLAECYDARLATERLAVFGREELLADRAVVMVHCDTADDVSVSPTGDAGPGQHNGAVVVTDDGAVPFSGPDVLHEDSLVRRSLRTRQTVRVTHSGDADAWLDEALPHARNLAVVPMTVEPPYSGVLVLEYSGPGRWRRERRLERRLVTTAEQAAGQGALAISRAMLMRRLQDAAQTDGLTQIANRRTFDESLSRELEQSKRSGQPLAVMILDLDMFKQLNDTHGHLEGDQTLRDVAAALRRITRRPDLVARYGGEEFAVLLTRARVEDAEVAAERYRATIEGLDRKVPVTASIGVAAWPEHGGTEESLLLAADDALYAAKRAGRNRFVISRSDRLAFGDVPTTVAN